MRHQRTGHAEHVLGLSSDQFGERLGGAFVIDARHLYARHRAKQLAGDMHRAAVTRGGVVELAGAGTRQVNQRAHRFRRHRRMHHQYVGGFGDRGDGRKVAHIRRHAVAHKRQQPEGLAAEQKRIAVGRGFGRHIGRQQAAVFNNHLLAERRTERPGNQTRREITATAGPRRDDAYMRGRPRLRPQRARQQQQQTQRRRVTQEFFQVQSAFFSQHAVIIGQCRGAGNALRSL